MNNKILHTAFAFLMIYIQIINTCKAQEDQNAVLWEISGNGLSKPSYLFGIVNFLPQNEFTISGNVYHAIRECDLFVTKMPMTNASQKEFTKAARIPDNGWINDYLTDDELNQLRLLMLLDLEVTENDYHFTYSRLQPVILVTATTLLYLGDDVVFVEDELAKVAKKSRLKFSNLESVEEEIAAFEEFPIPDQVEALKYTVSHWDEHINDYNTLVKAYIEREDLKIIHDQVLKATNRSKPFQEVYYNARNKSWEGKIREIISNNSAFLAVGAAHFYGENGLIHLLQNEGYTLTPISAF